MTKIKESPIQFTGNDYDALHPDNYNSTTDIYVEAKIPWWRKGLAMLKGEKDVPDIVRERAHVDAVVDIKQHHSQRVADNNLYDDEDFSVEQRYPQEQVYKDGQKFYMRMIRFFVAKKDILALERFYNEVLLNRGDLIKRVGSKEAISHIKTYAEMQIEKLKNSQVQQETAVIEETAVYSTKEREILPKQRKNRRPIYPYVDIIPNNQNALEVLELTAEPIPPIIFQILVNNRGESIKIEEITEILEQQQFAYFYNYFLQEKGLDETTARDIATEYARHLWFHRGNTDAPNTSVDMRILQKINLKRTIVVHGYLDDPIILAMANIKEKSISFQRKQDIRSASIRVNYKGVGKDEFTETRIGTVPLRRVIFITSTDMYGKNPSSGFLYDKNKR